MTFKREKKPFLTIKAEFFFWGGGLTQALAFFDQKHGVTPSEK